MLKISLMTSQDVRPLASCSNAAIQKMSGNGMHLGSAGFCALVAMLCTRDKSPLIHCD